MARVYLSLGSNLAPRRDLQIRRNELQCAFVLRPIADIAPDFRHPGSGQSMAELRAAFPAGAEALRVELLPK